MGHHSASCALSGLPIFTGNDCVVIKLEVGVDKMYYHGFTYSCLNMVRDVNNQRRYNKEMIAQYKELGVYDTLYENHKNILEREYKCPFSLHKGQYSGYGDLKDNEELGKEEALLIFVHPTMWELAQQFGVSFGLYEFLSEEENQLINFFEFAMYMRIELHFSHRINLGFQDPDETEFEWRRLFVEALAITNEVQIHQYCPSLSKK